MNIFNITKEEIQGLSGEDFERLVMESYIVQGFEVMQTPKSSDYGADVIVQTHIGKIAIQCKRQTATVGIKAVQEVFASTKKYGASISKIITSSSFSANAVELAKCCGVELINGQEFWQDIILPIQNDEFSIKEKKRFEDELRKLEDRALEYEQLKDSIENSVIEYQNKAENAVLEKVAPYMTSMNKALAEMNGMIAEIHGTQDTKFSVEDYNGLCEDLDAIEIDLVERTNELDKKIKSIKKLYGFGFIALAMFSTLITIFL